MIHKRIENQYDTSSNLQALNQILLKGEIVVESDTGKIKIGNGIDKYNDISYYNAGISVWKPNTKYRIDDLVVYSGVLYQCTRLHTSTSDFNEYNFAEVGQGGTPTTDEEIDSLFD